MIEEVKLIVAALRTSCEENGSCPDCPVNYWCHAKNGVRLEDAAADLIETLSKQLDDQTVVIDRIYEQCRTLQNDLKELGFDSIAEMYVQLEQTENKLSELLSYATGGRFSKADYSIDDMRRFVDDYNQSTCDECDQLEQVEMERDGLNIMLAQAQTMLETRTKERDAAVEMLREAAWCCDCTYYEISIEAEPCKTCHASSSSRKPNWQWRGVREVEHGI